MPDEMDDYAKSLDDLNADDLGLEDQFGDFYQRRYSGGVVVLDNPEDDQLSDTGLVEKHRLAVHKILYSYIGSDVNAPRSIALTYLGNCNYKLSFILVVDEKGIRPYLKLDAASKMTMNGYWIYDDGKMRIAVDLSHDTLAI